MGKDSAYYKDKKRQQTLKYRELLSELPNCAKDFLYEKEISSQTSTLISYAYDLLTFFRFLQQNNSYYNKKEIKKISDFWQP